MHESVDTTCDKRVAVMGLSRPRRRVARVVVALVAALVAGPAPGTGPSPVLAQVAGRLTLGANYTVQRIDAPSPATGGNLGEVVNAGDVNGDGVDDFLSPYLRLGEGEIFVFSGATGELIRSVPAPDPSTVGTAATFGRMVGKLEDVGSCRGGQPGRTCPLASVGALDGTPEFLVGATGVDIDGGVNIGRAYVIDGASGAVLKRVDMPPADRASEAAVAPGLRPFSFGRSVLSPASAYPAGAPRSVKIGDMDGGGLADFVVGNSTFFEAGPATNPTCNPGPCAGSGRVYFFRGEDVAGSDPGVVLDTPYRVVKNPASQTDDPNAPVANTDSEFFGHSLTPVGDLGRCTVDPGAGAVCVPARSTNAGDGLADVVVSAVRANVPGFSDAGAAYLFDGATGSVLIRYDHPEPQAGVLFGFNSTAGGAIGDVGNTTLPDVYLPSIIQGRQFIGQGRGYVFNGNIKTGPSTVVLSFLDDPTPSQGGNFGAPAAAVGDVAGDPRNEILVGALGPFIPGDDESIIGDAHVMSPITGEALLTLRDPDQQPGSAFGTGVASMGDLNGDGFMDFVVGAGSYDGAGGANQGRIYLFRSAPPAGPRAPTPSTGYRLVSSDGGVFAFGDATYLGSTGNAVLQRPIVALASSPSGRGYWMVSSDGTVIGFGDARNFGSTGNLVLNRPVVAIAPSRTGNGYWLVSSDGGVFAFGDARLFGSASTLRLRRPIVGMAATASGQGYWLVADDGGVFAFGDARFVGSTGALRLRRPVVAISASPTGAGYRLVADDGGVFAFGDVPFLGSLGSLRLNRPVTGIAG
ncbi:MAG: integrin alpha [Acidimicrobiales bacterium]